MPNPKKGENLKHFTERFMSNPEAMKTYPDIKQRYAVMRSIWDRRKKKAAMAWVVNEEDYILNDTTIEDELKDPIQE